MGKNSAKNILVRSEGNIGFLELNNPEKLNAISLTMWSSLGKALEGFSKNSSIRCVMIKGAGNKAFSAGADISEFEMQYLYSDGKDWYFMHPETFEQVAISDKMVGSLKNWVTEEDICKILLWDEQPISVMAPNFVDLEIVETDPGVKGDTVSGGSKPATLSTGAIIKVPLFLSKGEIVTIDTRNGEYQGRK